MHAHVTCGRYELGIVSLPLLPTEAREDMLTELAKLSSPDEMLASESCV